NSRRENQPLEASLRTSVIRQRTDFPSLQQGANGYYLSQTSVFGTRNFPLTAVCLTKTAVHQTRFSKGGEGKQEACVVGREEQSLFVSFIQALDN
ncbi:hypothetical protein BaRGS_00036027, partial [Batillaria attramentaria]